MPERPIQERMLWHLFMAEDQLARAANVGNNGPSNVEGLVMTLCVPNEHVVLAEYEEVVV